MEILADSRSCFGINVCLLFPFSVQANGLLDETLNGNYEYSRFPLLNYQLDYYVDTSWDWLPWNWARGLGNHISEALFAMTNMIWILSLLISSATGYVVQEAFNLDFVGRTANQVGQNIQTIAGVTRNGISGGFYGGFLLMLIVCLGIYVLYTGLLKHETTKAFRAVLNFITILLVSTSFIAFAPEYISNINDFSRDISTETLRIGTHLVMPDSNIRGQDSTDLIRDNLFAVQVIEPWKVLQFGATNISIERVDSIRSASYFTDERENAVRDEITKEGNMNLTVTSAMSRLGIVFFLFLFNIVISIFLFLLTGFMIFSQIIFMIFAIISGFSPMLINKLAWLWHKEWLVIRCTRHVCISFNGTTNGVFLSREAIETHDEISFNHFALNFFPFF